MDTSKRSEPNQHCWTNSPNPFKQVRKWHEQTKVENL